MYTVSIVGGGVVKIILIVVVMGRGNYEKIILIVGGQIILNVRGSH